MTERISRTEATGQSQWQTLDELDSKGRGLGQSTIMSVVRQTPIGPLSPWIAALITLVLVGATVYVGLMVRASVRSSVEESLKTALSANSAALEFWLQAQRDRVQRLASDPAVRSRAVQVLVPDDEGAVPFILSADQLQGLRADGYVGWVLTDPLGVVVASDDDTLLGREFPIPKQGDTGTDTGQILTPFDLKREHAQGASSRNSVLMASTATIEDGLRIAGRLMLLMDPGGQFSEILTAARIGSTGETYAIDRDAVLISRSRFETQLVRAGMLNVSDKTPLRIHARDPGIDIRFEAPEGKPESWPMTLMADNVTRGGTDLNLLGYNDYRGVPVVGAWKWLSEYGFGITTEVDYDEAYAPLRILRNSFVALLALVLIAGTSLFAIAWITRPREKESQRVAELGRRLGQYELSQRIGKGGMGTVYLGAHGLLDRKVAVKVLENTDATERSLARFQREVQLTAKLQHPNTIEIYDFGRTDEGTFFYVMEFVDGISLEQLVDYYGRQPAERVIYLLLQVCGSIAEAHQSNMVHRDIKPANVLLTARSGLYDLIKVLDFGLAKQVDHDSMQLTRVDSLTGTPLYMSPESIRDAAAADNLSDIYSIGAVGYTLLTGVVPFDEETSADVCAKKLHEEPVSPSERIGAPLPLDVQRVIMQCLRLDPAKRPQSVEALAAELTKCTSSPHWNQQDAALWWQQVFDGPYIDEFDFDTEMPSADGTKGDTAVSDRRLEKVVND